MGWLSSVSYVSAFFLREWENFLYPTFTKVCSAPRFQEGLLAVTVFAVVAGGLLHCLRLAARRWLPAAVRNWVAVLLLLGLLVPLNQIRLASNLPVLVPATSFTFWHQLLGAGVWALLALLAVGALVAGMKLRQYSSKVLRGLVFVFPVFILQGLAGLFWCPTPAAAQVTRASVQAQQPRVVWMLFDEFSQEALESMLADGTKFPNTKRFFSSGWMATGAIPPAAKTALSVPALFWGDKTPTQSPEEPVLYKEFTESGIPGPLQSGSIWEAAKARGLRTAIFGMPMPYCANYGRLLDECLSIRLQEYGFERGLGNNLTELLHRAASRHGDGFVYSHFRLKRRVQRAILKDETDLMFVHWFVPHPPGIYDATTKRFRVYGETQADYHGNLVVLDMLFGEILQWVDAAARREQTYLLVTSDHAIHRYREWAGNPENYDVRVPVFVRTPQVGTLVTSDKKFNSALQRELVEGILAQKIRSTEDVSMLAASANRTTPYFPYESEAWHSNAAN